MYCLIVCINQAGIRGGEGGILVKKIFGVILEIRASFCKGNRWVMDHQMALLAISCQWSGSGPMVQHYCHGITIFSGTEKVKEVLRGSDSSDFTSLETLKFKNPPFQHISITTPTQHRTVQGWFTPRNLELSAWRRSIFMSTSVNSGTCKVSISDTCQADSSI